MQKVNASMCLKINRDTFVFPDSNQGVFIRNNEKSLRMDGSTIDRWLERLTPMLDGTHTLQAITKGLPEAFQEQVYKIVQILYENGFARDVSQNLPHQLSDDVLNQYASQIEYLDQIRGSGAYRFQGYRQTKAAVISCDSLLPSLVQSLLQSGLSRFTVFLSDSQQSLQLRLNEMVEEAVKKDSETKVMIMQLPKNDWSTWLKPYDSILYGSSSNDVTELRTLHSLCKKERKTFLPVTLSDGLAFAGPLVTAKSDGCWESAFRRIHQRQDQSIHSSPSQTACALLANVAVFEWFKEITGMYEDRTDTSFYLLNLETLEGTWQLFLPHPLVSGRVSAEPVENPAEFIEAHSHQPTNLHPLFMQITSREAGIFHVWEEADLLQLPLSQCKVQVADPNSEGPAKLFPELICSGLTHEEARLEAGMLGLERYVSSYEQEFFGKTRPLYWGAGVGQTAEEGMGRALQNALHDMFLKKKDYSVSEAPLDLSSRDDDRCQFLWKSLRTLKPDSQLFSGETLLGFPVVWVKDDEKWHGSVGLNLKMAVNRALQTALVTAQNEDICHCPYGVTASSVAFHKEKQPEFSFKEETWKETLLSATDQLNKKAQFYELQAESFFNEHTRDIYGVALSGVEQT
ncbi:bacteriocin maturation protein [Fictibacillus fluitans]|uniref:Bacteriocin maturation protein n=1 Tax=Fictibacillus fluitans TaxID=3058422 RepID=A0ABT8HWE8_9BACL|nr:bacteriocin maturation protein [Fictibacillus sp. NE201]MDN4525053.1 bacteriocin maturation protein [Fictibacillus sp. NE201]